MRTITLAPAPNTLTIDKKMANKRLSQDMIRTLAHEIRNPLANIRLSVELLQTESIQDRKEYFHIISRNTTRINDLLTDMLQSFNTNKIQTRYHSINRILEESLDMAKDRIILKGVRVEKSYDQRCNEQLLAEPEIKIAFLNLIINAIEAMADTNGLLKLITTTRNGKCSVIIEDNGSGISPANLKKLFKPYFTTKPTGIGLGLSASLHILQAQKATLKVESEEGKGTRFIISF